MTKVWKLVTTVAILAPMVMSAARMMRYRQMQRAIGHPALFPDPLGAEGADRRINACDGDAFEKALRNDHPVEGITMV